METLWAVAVKLLASSSLSLPYSKRGILYIAAGWSHFLGGHGIDHVHLHTHTRTLRNTLKVTKPSYSVPQSNTC